MLTGKAKAEELIEKYRQLKIDVYDSEDERYTLTNMFFYDAKVCAKIAVDEILLDLSSYRFKGYLTLKQVMELRNYWQDVKLEIDKI